MTRKDWNVILAVAGVLYFLAKRKPAPLVGSIAGVPISDAAIDYIPTGPLGLNWDPYTQQ
jgi:hypothetical protein